MIAKAKVKPLMSAYEAWHWGAKADKVIHVADPLCPDLVGIGDLRQVEVDGSPIDLPDGVRIGFDPKHPKHRLYIVLPKPVREQIRGAVKYAKKTVPLQTIATAAGGWHAKLRKLPNIQAVPLGPLTAIVYYTYKRGEEDDRPSEYIHHFGKEHANGIVPTLALDVSGRMWVCGGAYFAPLAGVTG